MSVLENPLATIEFNFLEQLQFVKEWNNHLFEIFKWLDEVEDKLFKHNQLHVILLNDDHIFFKKKGEKKIGIYQNSLTLKPEVSKQLIVICSEREISNQVKNSITTFIESLLRFLKEKKIESQVLPESYMTQLSESLAVEQMIEVLIGIS
ncbi:MAG: hypothetical protein FWG67_04585 [Defluviitaleaceae bacterium]|nr:hypothetical protein [Defluviitaleaceae bacterium]